MVQTEIVHIPVMREEVLENMNLRDGGVYVDATIGTGSHAEAILESVRKCTLIGIDIDEEAIAFARERLSEYKNVFLIRDRFVRIKEIIRECGYERVDGVLMDLGVSALQLRSEHRGFSFTSNAPLDMRMDTTQRLTARNVVNTYSESALAEIIWRYGEERLSRKIARAIVRERKKRPITTCRDLASLIERIVKKRNRIHPATRTFQALRIEVNRELHELESSVYSAAEILSKEGRLCVLSYHSLEDRIIKKAFKRLAQQGMFRIITPKPLRPSREEILRNPSSRSAKLRVLERGNES